MKTKAIQEIVQTGPRINVKTLDPTGINNIKGLGIKALNSVKEALPVLKGEAKQDEFFKQHTDKVVNIGRSAKHTGFEEFTPLNEIYVEVRKKGIVNWFLEKRKHTEYTDKYNTKEDIISTSKKAIKEFSKKDKIRQRALKIKRIRTQKKKALSKEIQDSTMPWIKLFRS